jgi:chromosome segregation ATPase
MEDSGFNPEKFQTISSLFAEIAEMQHQLKEKNEIKMELENVLSQLKRLEEESRAVRIALEEQLTDSNAARELLLEKLEQGAKERSRIEEEFCAVRISLEEQLANSNTAREHLSEELEREVIERKRLEEEFRTARISLEEQLAKYNAEKELFTNKLQHQRQTLKQALDNLQERFNTLNDLTADDFRSL